MGGIISHSILGLISASLVFYYWKKPEFAFATFVGNVIVDVPKFLISAISQKNAAIFFIDQDKTFLSIANFTSGFANWFSLGFVLLTTIGFLYHHHIIRKKTLEEYDELVWAFIIGVVLHLVLDLFFVEKSFLF